MIGHEVGRLDMNRCRAKPVPPGGSLRAGNELFTIAIACQPVYFAVNRVHPSTTLALPELTTSLRVRTQVDGLAGSLSRKKRSLYSEWEFDQKLSPACR